jgi:hypothetical protein
MAGYLIGLLIAFVIIAALAEPLRISARLWSGIRARRREQNEKES